uniref:Ribosome biogenesis protein BOP1 homolog n=1 Tax=Piliocolobus tephrosceles TaxID=591936 RepID=A0A8C9H8R1_9PRIM
MNDKNCIVSYNEEGGGSTMLIEENTVSERTSVNTKDEFTETDKNLHSKDEQVEKSKNKKAKKGEAKNESRDVANMLCEETNEDQSNNVKKKKKKKHKKKLQINGEIKSLKKMKNKKSCSVVVNRGAKKNINSNVNKNRSSSINSSTSNNTITKKIKKNVQKTDYEKTTEHDTSDSSIESVKTKTNNSIYANEEIDESDDEYNLNTIGDFDLKHYDDLDIIGYDIEGKRIQKDGTNTIDDFIELKSDPNAWRKIKDKKNNRVIELTDSDLQIIKSIRENKIAKYNSNTEYIYENDKDEYKKEGISKIDEKTKEKRYKKMLNNLFIKLQKHAKNKKDSTKQNENYEKLYDLWRNKIYNISLKSEEMNLPFLLPGHKLSYNPPTELINNDSEIKSKNNIDIVKNYEYICNLESYDKTYFELYQRCLDLFLCSRTIKKVLHINKEDLLPKLESTKSLRPYPQYSFIKYVINNEEETEDKKKTIIHNNNIDINEQDHLLYMIHFNKLYIFDILSSYILVVIDLTYYYNFVLTNNKKKEEKKKKKYIYKFDNIMIKVNKLYSIVAICCNDYIFLFHYGDYVPAIKGIAENVINIHSNGNENINKRRKHVVGMADFENTDLNDDKVVSSGDISDKEHLAVGSSKLDNQGIVDVQNGDDDGEDGEDGEDGDDGEDGEDGDDGDDIDSNKESDFPKKKIVELSREISYSKTKSLIGIFNQKFKKSDKFIYSPDVDVKWFNIKPNDPRIKYCVAIKHEGKIKHFTWNTNGNYLSVTCLRKIGQYHICYLHHLKTMKSMKLIKKYIAKRGDVIQTMFYPCRPYYVVAFENIIKIYDLKASSVKKRIIKKLKGVKNITCVDVHKNESYILASNDKGDVYIFDLDLSSTPYKKFHVDNCSLKKVEFHKIYNLFYTLSSEGVVNLFYSKFFDDYITNPVLLPINKVTTESKITDIVWSDKKPWFFAHTDNNYSSLFT